MGGPADGPLLLLCHATGFCARAYGRLAAEMARHFHVLGPDFRGHGETAPFADKSFDWSEMAGDLVAVANFAMAELAGPAGLFGFGHSLGGALILLAEAARPGLFEAAYLYEPIVLPDDLTESSGSPLVEAARRRRRAFASRAEALYRYSSRPPLDSFQAGALFDYVEHGFEQGEQGVVLRCAPEDEAATYEASGKPRVSELDGLKTRCRFACGSQDEERQGPSSWAPAIAAALGASFERHGQMGHFGPLEDPRRIGSDAIRFLGS